MGADRGSFEAKVLATVRVANFCYPFPKRLTVLLGHPQRTAQDGSLTEADIRALIALIQLLERGISGIGDSRPVIPGFRASDRGPN
jgi:hypothetical protein